MKSFSSVLQPGYYAAFQCTAANCIETCCAGWGNVVVEKSTYECYEKCRDVALAEQFSRNIVKNTEVAEAKAGQPYAFIKLENGKCPFLTRERLCQIQKKLGEQALSITCDTYPRNFNKVNEILQRALDVSCPTAAKLVLLNKQGIQFEACQINATVRNALLPEIKEGNESDSKVHRYFNVVQQMVIKLLQNRNYSMDQRLMLVSMFCEKLESMTELPLSKQEFTDGLLAFETELKNKALDSVLEKCRPDIGTQVEAMMLLIDYSLKGSTTDAFRSCVQKCKAGLDMQGVFSMQEVVAKYGEAYRQQYQPKIDKYMYILENYLVNNAFKDVYPVGPQINAFFDEYSIRRIHMIFVIKYTILRTILIGMAGAYKQDFNEGHMIKAIQSFEKTIGHNLSFLKQAANFMDAAQIRGTAGCLLLLKI